MNKLPFKITDKVKADFQATIDFWDAARKSDNINFCKRLWSEYYRISEFSGGCSFCKYFLCYNCPLPKLCGRCNEFNKDNLYGEWFCERKDVKKKNQLQIKCTLL